MAAGDRGSKDESFLIQGITLNDEMEKTGGVEQTEDPCVKGKSQKQDEITIIQCGQQTEEKT